MADDNTDITASDISGCLKFCCQQTLDNELTLPAKCPFPAGVYRNVDIEIGENCQIIRLEKSDKTPINLCDPCPD